MRSFIQNTLFKEVAILPLIVFRIVFGLLMLIASLRFMAMGWIETALTGPEFHFTYYGFHWIEPLSTAGMYGLYAILALCCLFIMLGLFYRISSILFFIIFTYVEVIEKALYLNHYYFISILSFLLIFIPLHHNGSLDSLLFKNIRKQKTPYIYIFIIQLQLGIVYFFAGLAKLKYDWLFEALPLKIWLNSREDLPLLGALFTTSWFPFLMSWAGAIYDLSIPFLLWNVKLRKIAYLAVIIFHLLTGYLFNIGMFPYVMIACTLIFFSAKELFFFKFLLLPVNNQTTEKKHTVIKYGLIPLSVYFSIQLLMPLRHFMYPGNVLWTEEGFRFSWKVMLVEKTGYVEYRLRDPDTGHQWIVYPQDYLTKLQYTEMSYQPDMILQFAHYLKEKQYPQEVEVYVNCFVSLNGRSNKRLINPAINLAKIEDGWGTYKWVLR